MEHTRYLNNPKEDRESGTQKQCNKEQMEQVETNSRMIELSLVILSPVIMLSERNYKLA